MEARTISFTEYKIYVLSLNPMRGHAEDRVPVAISYERQKLIDWVNSFVEPIVEEGSPSFQAHGEKHEWHKTYKVGSPLEWYNPPHDFMSINIYGHGIQELWANQNDIDQFQGVKLL